MGKFLRLTLLFCITSLLANAQQKNGTVKGIIYDSVEDIPLTSATVVICKKADSTFLNFQVTDYKGEFNITGLPAKTPMYLTVTYTGYNAYTKNISFDPGKDTLDLKKIHLEHKDSNQLMDVEIKSVAPIKMNGDTLEINPDAFKLDSNAVVEDMLLRVPGMVVWSDGTITMNGKKIEKLLVDGKPFFGGQTNIATQNLPKDAIKKIQLYQEKDMTKLNGSEDKKQDSLYSMNIQLKEDKKKGIFGKVSAGYGTDKRYDAYGVLQAYDPKNQMGIAFGTDNINKSSGIGSDAFLQNTFKQNFLYYRYSNPSISGIKRNIWGSGKFQHSFNETDNGQFFSRLTGDYTYTNTNLNNTSNTDQTDNILDYKQHSISSSQSNNTTGTHTASFVYERRKKFGDYININTNFNHTDDDDENTSVNNVSRNDTSISYNNVATDTKLKNNNFSVGGIISSNDYQNKRSPLKNYFFNFNVNYNDNNSLTHTNNVFRSFIDTIPSSTIIRNYNNNSNNFSANAMLRYNGLKQLLFGIYNFYKIDVGLNNGIGYSRSTQDSRVQDLDTVSKQYVTNDYLTNTNTLTNFSYTPGLYLGKFINKNVYGKYYYYMGFNASIDHRWIDQKNASSLLYRNIEKRYSLWVPGISMNFYKEDFNHYRINSYVYASINPSVPSVDQLVPIIDTSNRYNTVVGNPQLQVGRNMSVNYNFNLDRANQKAKSGYGFSINGAYTATHNAVADSTRYDGSGKSIHYLLNMNGSNSFNLGGDLHFSTKFKTKYQFQTRYTPTFNISNSPGYINGVLSSSHNKTLGNRLTASFIIIDKFNTTLGENITTSKNRQAGAMNLSPSITNYTTSIDATYSITKKWNISSNFNYQANKAVTNSSNAAIWNATTSCRFMKDEAEIKFTAFDMLRQNKNIINFLNQNSIGTTVTNGLRQYFMLSFSFYPRKFGGKANSSRGIMIMR